MNFRVQVQRRVGIHGRKCRQRRRVVASEHVRRHVGPWLAGRARRGELLHCPSLPTSELLVALEALQVQEQGHGGNVSGRKLDRSALQGIVKLALQHSEAILHRSSQAICNNLSIKFDSAGCHGSAEPSCLRVVVPRITQELQKNAQDGLCVQ